MSFEYVIKFVIGASPARPEVVAPGYYWTAINIFNASACTGAKLRWKVARALPGLVEGVSSPWRRAVLSRGHGFEIDNADIDDALRRAGDERKHVEGELGSLVHGKGFVVVRSDIQLDIVAVYTASGKDGGVSLHTERVAGRELRTDGCSTLTVNLDTNDRWTLVSTPNSTQPTPAAPYTAEGAWAAASGAAQWIGLDWDSAEGLYVFERQFNVDCDSDYTLGGQLLARSDNTSRYLLNGVEFASLADLTFRAPGPQTLPLPPAGLLRAGVNTLRVEVSNDGGPVGLMLSGSLTVGGGTCERRREEPTKGSPVEPAEAEKHGDILVDGVKIDFDKQAPVEPAEKHGDVLVDGVKIDFDRQVQSPVVPTKPDKKK